MHPGREAAGEEDNCVLQSFYFIGIIAVGRRWWEKYDPLLADDRAFGGEN